MNPTLRDNRIDVWRGLCLLDMLLIHLIEQGLAVGALAHVWLFDYLRFAAGGFIFIAGLGMGAIWLEKFRKDAVRVTQRLWQRAGLIVLVHWAMTLSFLLLVPVRGQMLEPFSKLMIDVLLFRTGTDLLPFYAVMLVVSPALLWLLSRGMAGLMIALSAAVYALGWYFPHIGNLPIQSAFRVPLWQLVFVLGATAGWLMPRYDALTERSRNLVWAGSVAAALTTFVLAYGDQLGLLAYHPLHFWKWPLTWPEALRYVSLSSALFLTVDRLWPLLKERSLTAFAALLGRRSLPVYVAHMWVIGLLLWASSFVPLHDAANLIWWVVGAAMLWAVAEGVERFSAWSRSARLGQISVSRLVTPGWSFAAVAAVWCATLIPIAEMDESILATADEEQAMVQDVPPENEAADPMEEETLPDTVQIAVEPTLA